MIDDLDQSIRLGLQESRHILSVCFRWTCIVSEHILQSDRYYTDQHPMEWNRAENLKQQQILD